MKISLIDVTVIGLYLLGIFLTGYLASREIQSMRAYALGLGQYKTSTLVATLFATGISGSAVLGIPADTCRYGIIATLVCLTLCVRDLISAKWIAPQLDQFIKAEAILSVGDIMQHFYGPWAKIVTGLAGCALCVGRVGAQMFAIGYGCHCFLGIDYRLGILLGFGIVVLYTTYGGIRAVVMTDIYQAILILVVLPLLGASAIKSCGGLLQLVRTAPVGVFELPCDLNIRLRYLTLAIAFVVPFLGPTTVQRFLMAKNSVQIRHALCLSALCSLFFFPIMGLMGVCSFCLSDPGLTTENAFFGVIKAILPPGTQSVACVALLAAAMSTADSELNAASVAAIRDVVAPLSPKRLSDKIQLKLTRLATALLGFAGLIQATRFANVIDLVVSTFNCWGSTVLVPLYAGLFGLRASRKTFFGAVAAGQGMYWLWVFYLGQHSPLGSFIPSLLANALAFYLGWLRDGSPRGGSPSPQQHASARGARLPRQAQASGALVSQLGSAAQDPLCVPLASSSHQEGLWR